MKFGQQVTAHGSALSLEPFRCLFLACGLLGLLNYDIFIAMHHLPVSIRRLRLPSSSSLRVTREIPCFVINSLIASFHHHILYDKFGAAFYFAFPSRFFSITLFIDPRNLRLSFISAFYSSIPFTFIPLYRSRYS